MVVRGTVAGGHGEVGKSGNHGNEGGNDVVDALGLWIHQSELCHDRAGAILTAGTFQAKPVKTTEATVMTTKTTLQIWSAHCSDGLNAQSFLQCHDCSTVVRRVAVPSPSRMTLLFQCFHTNEGTTYQRVLKPVSVAVWYSGRDGTTVGTVCSQYFARASSLFTRSNSRGATVDTAAAAVAKA
jgi:hypothetical protein